MELKAIVTQRLGTEVINTKAGRQMSKQWYILKHGDNPKYPKTLAVYVLDNKVELLEVGREYNLSVDAESREYNGKWYTDIRVYRAVETVDSNVGAIQARGQQQSHTSPAPAPSINDLPF